MPNLSTRFAASYLACFGKPDPVDMKVYCPCGEEAFDDEETTEEAQARRGRKKHRPEEIVAKLRDADAMLNAGKELAVVLQTLEISEATLARWRKQYGGMKCEEAKRLRQLEDENDRLKRLVADLSLDNQMLKYLAEGNW